MNTTTLTVEKAHFSLIKSWLVWACAAMFYAYQFLLRVSPNVMTGELMEAFSVDACALGTLTGLYYYGYAALQVPGGTLIDKMGTKKMLALAALFCAGGTLLFSWADSLFIAGIGRLIIGAGSAFGFLSCLKTGTSMFPPQKLPLVIGMTLFLGIVGALVAGTPLVILIDLVGWRQALWILAAFGIGICLLAWFCMNTEPSPELKKYISSHHAPDPEKLGIIEGIVLIIKKPQSWILAFYGMLLYVPLSGFADLWGVPFFIQKYGFSKHDASSAIMVFYAGVALGGPCVSWVVNYFKSYKVSLFLAASIPFVLMSIVFYSPSDFFNYTALLALLLGAGFFLGSQFLIFTVICELNPLSVSSTAGGFLNMMCMISGVVFQPFIGKLLDLSWQGGFVDGVRAYSTADFIFAMSTIPLGLLIGTILVFFIKDAYPKG
ncbi:MFS transporter [Candidatus Bealeia paramacronuclearis]|uniref:Lysosomal dipeptide transporter MFSD1 n=1 Tax=Candidatus Bealeia paramacronuclearis TaxID=1921001 RepID=A0ABZ2C2A4_9PROT|nr:MFS transporter [Candidatus Bealeia paramacronuclearis]